MSSENKHSSTKSSEEYKSLKAETPNSKKTELQKKPTWIGRKYLKIKKALFDFWVVGGYGFKLGGAAGLILGFCVGGFESLRMKSFWPLPIAMIGSCITFGSIFAISTVLRSEEDINGEKIIMDIVYYDEIEGKYKKKNISLIQKFNFMESKNNYKF
jgi:hypothetical protein